MTPYSVVELPLDAEDLKQVRGRLRLAASIVGAVTLGVALVGAVLLVVDLRLAGGIVLAVAGLLLFITVTLGGLSFVIGGSKEVIRGTVTARYFLHADDPAFGYTVAPDGQSLEVRGVSGAGVPYAHRWRKDYGRHVGTTIRIGARDCVVELGHFIDCAPGTDVELHYIPLQRRVLRCLRLGP